MKKIVLLVVIFFIVLSSFSQINTFYKIYSQFYADIRGRSVTETQENSFIIVGNQGPKGFIANIDSIGNFIWQNSYAIPGWASVSFNDIAPTSDSCFIITGRTPNPNSGTSDLVCMKINTFGDTLWCKSVSGSGPHDGISVMETFDHGFITAGLENNIGVAKLDSIGNIEWRRAMTYGNSINLPVTIKQLPDSSYILLASVIDDISIDYGNAILANLSRSGDILWSKQYYLSTTKKYAGVDLLVIPTGIICYTADDEYMAIMKTDFAGNVLWAKRYSSLVINNCSNCGNSTINPVSDGGYIMTNGQPDPTSNYELKILKLDSTFNVLWSKEVVSSPVEVIETNDKGLLLLTSPTEMQALPYFGLVKMDSLGLADSCVTSSLDSATTISIISSVINPITIDSSGVSHFFNPSINNTMIEVDIGCINNGQPWGINKKNTTSNISIFPNPFNFQATIVFNDEQKNTIIRMKDLTGREIKSVVFTGKQLIIEKGIMKAGIYIVQIIDTKNNIINKKIIIQ